MNLKPVIEHLEKLGRGEIKPRDTEVGTCHEIYNNFDIDIYLFLDFSNWVNFSGDCEFPITHKTLCSKDAFYQNTNHWDKRTKHGKDRLEFCLWCASELRKLK